jgi:EAL domain-containing protein (putative c-di-GMP-specific phosphodiesterase class I)
VAALNGHDAKTEYREVLLRLDEGHAVVLLPGAFIPAAERSQQTSTLDRWVVGAALAYASVPGHGVHYGINLSAQSLSDAGFLDFVLGHLETTAVALGTIVFEITETAAATDFNRARRFMDVLRERGCRFALDDFGSGLASFGYLKALPVDYLKIDRHFVKGIEDPFNEAVVKSIHAIARTLGLRTIAESVACAAILERVRAIAVDCAQGYAIARPASLLG